MHEPQNPLASHTWFDPHDVPAMTLPVPLTQTGAPLAHEITPTLHGAGLPLHPLPAAHDTQLPEALQTMLVPQLVPAALFVSSTHVCTPVEHEVTPFLHAPPGFVAHDWPAVHSVHCPLALQTMLVPQPVPAVFTAPSTQVSAPVAHDETPLVHGLGLPVHTWPAAQAVQPPLPSQTLSVPQVVPAERLPKSTHTGAPVEQLTMPVLHGVGLVEQFAFAVQVPQAPLPSQTLSAPQTVPAGLLASSTQVCVPVAHDVMPLLHVVGFPVQGCPALHATHVPLLLQTIPTPQLVPAGVFAPSVQVVPPPLGHVVVPCLQAVGLPVQLWLATHAPQKPLPSHS